MNYFSSKKIEQDELKICEDKLLKYYERKFKYFTNVNLEQNETNSAEFFDILKLDKCKKENIYSNEDVEKNSVVLTSEFSDGKNTLNYGVILPSKNQPWFRFMDPIIEISGFQTLQRNYKQIEIGDRLYIWVTLNKEGEGQHLTGVVVTRDNKHIGFGMGYDMESIFSVSPDSAFDLTTPMMQALALKLNPEGIYEARLFSSDLIIENQLLRQFTTPDFKGVRLIAAAELNADYVLYLNKEFDLIQYEHVNYQVIPRVVALSYFDNVDMQYIKMSGKQNILDNLQIFEKKIEQSPENEMDHILEAYRYFTTKTQNLVNTLFLANKGFLVLLYGTYTINIPSSAHMYCKYTGKSIKKFTNCTSFLQKIFGDLLNCGWFETKFLNTDDVVTNPAWCRQNFEKAQVPDCNKSLVRQKATRREIQKRSTGSGSDEVEKYIKLQFTDKDVFTYINTLSAKRLKKLIMSNKKYKKHFRTFLKK
jgi:hypothetical protein